MIVSLDTCALGQHCLAFANALEWVLAGSSPTWDLCVCQGNSPLSTWGDSPAATGSGLAASPKFIIKQKSSGGTAALTNPPKGIKMN